jgi:hypothetical protein
MVSYKHLKLPELTCYIEYGYAKFYPTNYPQLKYESTNKKLNDEQDISKHLDIIFADDKQIDALIGNLKFHGMNV